MRRGLERRELSLELGDARGQSMALGLERLAVADAQQDRSALGEVRVPLVQSDEYGMIEPMGGCLPPDQGVPGITASIALRDGGMIRDA